MHCKSPSLVPAHPSLRAYPRSIPSFPFLILSGHCWGCKCKGSMRQGQVSLCCVLQGNCHPSIYQNTVGSGHCSLCHWGAVVWGGRQENPVECGNSGVCYPWVPPALRRTTTVLFPATGALCCVTACPQGSAVHTHSSDHQHDMEAKAGWIKELAYGWWMEVPLAISKVQSVHAKWWVARCCKIGKCFSVVPGNINKCNGFAWRK